MQSDISCRRGTLEDLSRLKVAEGLSITAESAEFNILGMGHELWVAVEGAKIVAFIVLGRTSSNELIIMVLEVANSHKGRGIGSALVKAAMKHYAESDFVVIPSEGTEDFYRRLGFEKDDKWKMRRTLPEDPREVSKSM